jgi:hypothetical protein
VFKHHPIVFICPKSLKEPDEYSRLAEQQNKKIQFVKFEKKYFKSIDGYNQLLLSKKFYYKFRVYEYMLIYQTDAYVFNDQLEYWCNKGYDYIGAPWFEKIVKYDTSIQIIGVGNGGFSLRNVKKFISVTKRIEFLKAIYKYWKCLKINRFINFNKLILRLNFFFKIKSFWILPSVLNNQFNQEDEFFGQTISKLFSDFSLAPVDEAIKFSFEVNPLYLYELNNFNLPFGCHAWPKYDPNFWNNYISV